MSATTQLFTTGQAGGEITMRAISLAVVIMLLSAGVVLGQGGTIGIFSEPSGVSCNIPAQTSGNLQALYVVHVGAPAVTGCEFSAPKPDCFNAIYLNDTCPFSVWIGNSQTGVAIAYSECRTSPIHVLTINYLSTGTTPQCCLYPVLDYPNETPPGIYVVDCDFNLISATGLTSVINANVTCPCGIYPSVPYNPSPADGAVGQPVNTQLSWESSDPQGGALTYDLYLGTSANPPLVATDLGEDSYDPGLLSYNTTYWWKVTARDEDDNETMGPLWSFATLDPDNRLIVSSSTNYCGLGLVSDDTVRVDVTMQYNPIPVDAGGVDVTYDPGVLTYVRCEAGELTAGWGYFSGSDRGAYIRVGGFDLTPIPQWSAGRFARLVFVHDICAPFTPGVVGMCPQNLTDDLVSLAPVCGEYRYEKFLADGDVNDDGHVTPGDALCAFKAYLSFPSPPEAGCDVLGWEVRSDVNCSADLTPADALCIFENWLDESCTFCVDWQPLLATVVLSETPALVTFALIRGEEGEVGVSVRVSRVPVLKAFGFELSYPVEEMEYVGIERTLSTRGVDQLDARVVGPGRLRVGGYTTRAVNASRASDILRLRFKTSGVDLAGTMTIDTYVDDLRGAEPVTRILGLDRDELTENGVQLFQNSPNPFNPVTEISYEVPGYGARVPVELLIYNVEGKCVRKLVEAEQLSGIHRARWDGRNESGAPVSSGIYFYVLNAGSQTITKKMLLLK